MAAPATDRLPFAVPQQYKARAGSRWVQRTVSEFSDGDSSKWPAIGTAYRSAPSSREFYLCYLAQRWVEEDGLAEPGCMYYLDRLPFGYDMFQIAQPGGPQIYKRMFGHPTGRFYDSAKTFEVHFLWLMSEMEGDCGCVLCGARLAKPVRTRHRVPRNTHDRTKSREHSSDADTTGYRTPNSMGVGGLATSRAQRKPRKAGAPYAVDEEGNEDIYKDCIRKLLAAKGGTSGIEIDLAEDNCIDWKAERESLPRYLKQIELQHSFIPRIGELVLWCPDWPIDHYLSLELSTSEYKLYSFTQGAFRGFPAWRGGVVASVPSLIVKNGSIDFPDILDAPEKQTALNTAGFRVETFPDPNDDRDKSQSKQYKYVPLRNIRPLSHWRTLLQGIPQQKLHSSVFHALTCMTSISLLEKWRFRGDWPYGSIYCKGIYLGSEMITLGDVVRLQASGLEDGSHKTICTDVIVVTSIRYNMASIQPENASTSDSLLSPTSFISLVGDAYTTDSTRAYGAPFANGNANDGSPPLEPIPLEEVKANFRPVGTAEYGRWYRLHHRKHKFEVSHEHILGRLYEADAVRLWTGQRQYSGTGKSIPSLDFDADSIIAGRRYASATDERLTGSPDPAAIQWFLADTRAEGLALATFNGLDVGRYHNIRDLDTVKQWRLQLNVAKGGELDSELSQQLPSLMSSKDTSRTPGQRGRPAGSKVVDGKLYLAGELVPEGTITDAVADRKASSRMAGAALFSNSDEDEAEHELPAERNLASSHNAAYDTPISEQQIRKVVDLWSKKDIMTHSATTEATVFDDDVSSSSEEDDFSAPAVIRGGTEETEGGDYME